MVDTLLVPNQISIDAYLLVERISLASANAAGSSGHSMTITSTIRLPTRK
jgi:hypothetical protein